MKKAFTLIELLVVIAIIAILAAILFPVFAQAKVAAKKTTSISNQKQINLGIIMYTADYDDTYPRNDDCVANSSLDPVYNGIANPSASDLANHCTKSAVLGGFSWRLNHYAWQKWVMPYIKSVGLFTHPTLPLIKGTNNTNGVPTGFDQGEIASGYALNIAITGAQNSYGATNSTFGVFRDSFVGGTQTGIADPASALLTTEQSFFDVTGGWELNYGAQGIQSHTPYYPAAFKEHWEAMFLKSGGTGDCGVQPGVTDTTKVPFGQVPIGFADGHVKALSVGDFLGKTPSYQQITGSSLDTNVCKYFAAYGYGSSQVTPLISAGQGAFPLWGL